jgi:hypothetical protein
MKNKEIKNERYEKKMRSKRRGKNQPKQNGTWPHLPSHRMDGAAAASTSPTWENAKQ